MTDRTRKPSVAQHIMSEWVLCGGRLYTRKQLLAELLAEGWTSQDADGFVHYLKATHPTPEMLEYNQMLLRALRDTTTPGVTEGQ